MRKSFFHKYLRTKSTPRGEGGADMDMGAPSVAGWKMGQMFHVEHFGWGDGQPG